MTINKSVKSINLLILSVLLLFASCRKQSTSWDANVMIPLIHSELGIDDIFGDTMVVENPDQSWKLVLNQYVSGIDNTSLIEVHDTLSKDVFSIPIYFNLPPGQEVIKQESHYVMDLGEVELVKARAKNAQLKFYVTNTVKERLRIKYEVLSSEKDSKYFEVEEDVPAADANGPSHVIKTINLSDYNMDFTGPNHDRVNMVVSRTTVRIHPDGDTTLVTPSDSIVVTSVFEKLDIEYAKGYFGQSDAIASDSSAISTFNNFIGGYFNIDNIKAEFRINNYIGADVQLHIDEISSINTETNIKTDLSDPIIGRSLNLLRARESGDTANPVISRNYVFPLSNSNIVKLIENQPDIIGYSMKYTLNPMGNVSGGNDFVYADKSLEGIIHMEIPLNVKFDSLIIANYSNINFDSIGNIKSGNLILFAENHFPYDLDVQFYLLDNQRKIIDSLFHGDIKLNKGFIDGNGYVRSATAGKFVIVLDSDMLAKLRNSEEMLVWVRINNNDSRKFRLFSNYNVDIKLVLDAEYEY